jgi:hypothetical protein
MNIRGSGYQVISEWISGSKDIRTRITVLLFPDLVIPGVLHSDLLVT